MARRRNFDFSGTKAMLAQQFQQEDMVKNIILRELLQRQTMEQDDARTASNTAATHKFQREQGFLTNPETAVNALRGGIKEAEPFVPPVSSRMGDVRKMFAGKSSLSDLPSAQSIEGAASGIFGAQRPDIEAILAERQAEEARLSPLQSRTAVEQTNPDGSQSTQFLTTPELAGKTFNTGLSAQQTGSNKASELLAGEQSPALVNSRVSEAGRTAGAQAQARFNVEYSPEAILKKVDEYTQKAVAESAAIGDREAAKSAAEAKASALPASMALKQIKDLYDRVKITGGLAQGTRAAGRKLGSATGTLDYINPEAASLDRLTDQFAMLLYRGFGGTGANVSDRDISMMKGGLPYSHVLSEVGDEVFANAAALITYNPMIKARYGKQPFEMQIKIAQDWLQRSKQARAAGVEEFEDPYTPGTTVPVSKR